MKPFSIRKRYILPMLLLVMLIIAMILILTRLLPFDFLSPTALPPPTNFLVNERSKWLSHNINNYRMTNVTFGAPAPPAALDLVIRGGEIVEETIIACENPSEEYPARLCEPTRNHYSYLARKTIEDVFEFAESCVARMQTDLASCPYLPNDFLYFEDRDTMSQVVNDCFDYFNEPYLQLWVCTMQFDEVYGYPKEMSYYITSIVDGLGSVSIRDFQIIE